MKKKICFIFWLALSGLSYSETRYVVKDNPGASPPYTNWSTAAATIQAAVDVALFSDIILVSNGVYETGGRTANGALTNRVVVDKPLIVRSVNGPKVAVIKGSGPEGDAAIRCVYLGFNATLIGFMLTNGHTRTDYGYGNDGFGGGAFCEPSVVLSNCVATGNSAYYGGGVSAGTLYNCALNGNLASIKGGGVNCGVLYNCTLTDNSADKGGGAYYSTLYNCIVYYNTAPNGSNFDNCALNYCCATPDPGGESNITAEPLLVDASHLSAGSPCIGKGNPAYAYGADIDGEAWSDPPSIGCDEYHAGMVADRYVSADSPTPAFPFATWGTAASNIQDAVDAATPYDIILVSNGVYEAGGRTANGALMNRVAIDKPVVVRSVNGPQATFIRGNADPQYTNGESAVRCVYLGTNATLIGFTLTNGHTRISFWPNFTDCQGGGVYCESAAVLSNCVVTGNSAQDFGGGAIGGALYNCTLTGNSAYLGGGAYSGMLYHCALNGNSADAGGGAYGGTLYNCALTGNSADAGGGACNSALYNCTLVGNSVDGYYNGGYGGGTYNSALYNCTLVGNSADGYYSSYGGGTYNSALYNCTLVGNSVDGYYNGGYGGGAYDSTLCNCTLTGNSADGFYGGHGGGTYDGVLHNCIVYYNSASDGPNISLGSMWSYCCTPDPGGEGNITNEPLLIGRSHLSAGSPCIGKGNPAYAYGADIDGESWSNPPSIGCDEYRPGAVADRYVRADSPTSAFPFATWDTAASNIQDAVDAATPYDIILVSNGVYEVGGRTANGALMNRVAIDKPVVVRSVHGPAVTLIKGNADPQYTNGESAVRCVYLGTNATLIGFTLTNGHTRTYSWPNFTDCQGGGLYGESGAILSNCVLTGNSAQDSGGGAVGGALYNCVLRGNSAGYVGGGIFCSALYNCALTGNSAGDIGGGACDGALYNCALTSNSARYGGGVSGGALYNCTLTGNSAAYGGGTYYGTSYNCIVYYNIAPNGPNFNNSTLNYCCTTPEPGGTGNLTNEPLLTIHSHLSANSPCIGKGNIAYASGVDIDGQAWSNPPSIGCDEYDEGTLADHYVKVDSFTPAFPFDTWDTAASNIQDAVDAADACDVILVNDGVYEIGGRPANGALTNRVAIDKPVVVRSVNGPQVTFIKGAGPEGDAAIRCVYLGTNATLIGFTLTNGHARAISNIADGRGGGAFCESSAVLSNCVLVGNVASGDGGGTWQGTLYHCALNGNSASSSGGATYNSALYDCLIAENSAGYVGGGTCYGTLYNCTLTSNSGHYGYGGGAGSSELYNCTLTGNSAVYGGGTYYSISYNCIVYHNTASYGPNFYDGALNHCCTTPDPGGTGNITNDPLFVDCAGGDLHLQSNSPCVNTGIHQDWMADSTDLDGNPRIRRSRVDMGAYESDHWGQFSDVDADGLSDWIEVNRTGTDPTNAASYLGMGTPIESDSVGTGLVVRWQSAADKTYRLARTTNLMESFLSLSNRLDATPPMNTYTDETAIGLGPWYYRVGVE